MIKGILLLAAGQSKRLKNHNKLLTKFKNKELILHSFKSIQKSKINQIIIVLGYQSNEIKKLIKKNKKKLNLYLIKNINMECPHL